MSEGKTSENYKAASPTPIRKDTGEASTPHEHKWVGASNDRVICECGEVRYV